MEMINYDDYRKFLKDRLEAKLQANASYSLRAFARDLKISPQSLSLILNGKRKISLDLGSLIAERLDLNFAEVSHFLDLVTVTDAKSELTRKAAAFRLAQSKAKDTDRYRSIDLDVFKIISDWYHMAILSLVETKDFSPEPAFIAKRLGISVVETELALERLLRLELLEEKDGQLKKTKLNITTTANVPSSAIRKYNRQILQKAIISIQEQSVDERDLGSMTMAIDPALLPQAQAMIQSFRRQLCEFLENGKGKEVYVFSSSLFRLTNPAN